MIIATGPKKQRQFRSSSNQFFQFQKDFFSKSMRKQSLSLFTSDLCKHIPYEVSVVYIKSYWMQYYVIFPISVKVDNKASQIWVTDFLVSTKSVSDDFSASQTADCLFRTQVFFE